MCEVTEQETKLILSGVALAGPNTVDLPKRVRDDDDDTAIATSFGCGCVVHQYDMGSSWGWTLNKRCENSMIEIGRIEAYRRELGVGPDGRYL